MKNSQLNKTIESIHGSCRIWSSELNFWEDENSFMKELTTKYCYLVPNKDQSLQLREIFTELDGSLDADIQRLRKRINYFQFYIIDLLERAKKTKVSDVENEFKALQSDLNLLRVRYQNLKKDLFDLMKNVLKEGNIEKRISNVVA